MKRISYKVNRSSTGGPRKARGKIDKVKSLNITSLVDILTILLVFLIKNVSIDAARLTVPDNMMLPTTVFTEEIERSGKAVTLKVYPDQILIGSDNTYVGTPEEFMTEQDIRSRLLAFLNEQSASVTAQNPDVSPLLLVQADTSILCRYITDLVALGATAGFTGIYFSTLKGEDRNVVYGS